MNDNFKNLKRFLKKFKILTANFKFNSNLKIKNFKFANFLILNHSPASLSKASSLKSDGYSRRKFAGDCDRELFVS